MYLVLHARTAPPRKQEWHVSDSSLRGEWSQIFEVITTWFCRSNDLNKQFNVIIQTPIGSIWFFGKELRYLAPSARSAASLIDKAYQNLTRSSTPTWQESTPGVYYSTSAELDLPEPYYHLVVGEQIQTVVIQEGTLFDYPTNSSNPLTIPGSQLAQGLVWVLQENIIYD